MKAFNFLLAGLIVATLAACGKSGSSGGGTGNGTVSVDSDGHCTSLFIVQYNNVRSKAIAARDALNGPKATLDQAMRELQLSCRDFYANHSGVTCTALVDGSRSQVDAGYWQPKCDAADGYLKDNHQ